MQTNIISGYTPYDVDGGRLTVHCQQSTVNSQPSTLIYYSDANGFDITRPKWLGSIALILEIATIFLLSLGCGNLIEYPLAKPAG